MRFVQECRRNQAEAPKQISRFGARKRTLTQEDRAAKCGTAVIQTGSGTIIIRKIEGIDPEEHRVIAAELGVTKAALKSLFKILERQEVPPEDLDSTLRTIATRYKELDQKLATFTSEDPAVVKLKRAAREALEAGEFEQAEALLNEASDTDVAAAQAMQAAATDRLPSAAASKAENGDLKYTQLAYTEAAAYYHEAAGLVPEGEEAVRAKYLNDEGNTWNDADLGFEFLHLRLLRGQLTIASKGLIIFCLMLLDPTSDQAGINL